MSLKVKLIVQKRSHPMDDTEPDKYYLKAVKTGNCDLERVAYLISNQSTVREPDCLAVLHAFVNNMLDELSQGRVVELGALGNFQVGVRSTGSLAAEEVSLSNIKRIGLNFRPSQRVKKRLVAMDFNIEGM